MEATLKSVSYGLIINDKKYKIDHCLIWKKEYAEGVAFWETTINGTTMINKNGYTFSYRKTMPSKSEMKRHIEKYWYPDLEYPNFFDIEKWAEKRQVWYNPIFSRETIKKYEK